MKESVSPFASAPGERPAPGRAHERKASDREGDFAAALALTLGGGNAAPSTAAAAEEEAALGAPKPRDVAPKVRGDAPRLGDDAPTLHGGAPRLDDGAPTLRGGAPRLRDDAPKLPDDGSKLDDGAPEPRDAGPKLLDGLKPDDGAPKLSDDGSKLDDDAPEPRADGPKLPDDGLTPDDVSSNSREGAYVAARVPPSRSGVDDRLPHARPEATGVVANFDGPTSAAAEPAASAPAPALIARPAAAPAGDPLPGQLDTRLVLDASGAKLTLRDTPSGDLALDVRIRDGALDIRARGTAAPVMTANEAELRLALVGAGMRLGQLAIGASVEGRVSAAPSSPGADRRRLRDEERDGESIGDDPHGESADPARVHLKA